MSRFIRICASSLGRKYIMALTGLLLGGFLVVHAAGNSMIFQGRAAFNAYAAHLHSLEPLLSAAGVVLLAILLLHILTGFSLVLRNQKAKGRQYAIRRSAAGLRSWPARIMPYTGAAVLAFLLLHLATVRFADQALPVADKVGKVLTSPLFAACYALGIAALGLHISHGFWLLTQSLGISHPRWDGLIRGLGRLIGIAVIGIFANIILLHLFVAGCSR
jgi:succinate dehydrogenase / fumarate reductase cytochrome b subunit